MKKVVCGLLVVASLVGCGILKPAKQEEISGSGAQAQAASAAESLNLRIVRAGEMDAHLPDAEADLNGPRTEDPITIKEDRIVFGNDIFLPNQGNPKELFLVWPEDWMGSKISYVTVTYRVVDVAGQPVGVPQNVLPDQDPKTGRWWLPFASLFQDDSAEVDPALQQQLIFSFQLADRTQRFVEVRLRVVGGAIPPKLQVSEKDNFAEVTAQFHALATGNPTLDFSPAVERFSAEGLLVHSTQVVNPGKRTVKVWLNADADEPLAADLYVGQQTFEQKHIYDFAPRSPVYFMLAAPVFNPVAWHFASQRMSIRTILVRTSDSKDPMHLDLNNGWTSFELASLQSAEIQWLALAQEQRHCGFPPSVPQHVTWYELSPNWQPRLDGVFDPNDPNGWVAHHADLAESWLVGGYEAKGIWSQKWGVSERWETQPGQIHSEQRKVAISDGVAFSAEALRSPFCQGLF